MKSIKTIAGILLIIGSLSLLMSFFNQVSSYDSPELIGHLLAIVLISGLHTCC